MSEFRSELEDFNSRWVSVWRSIQSENGLDPGRAKFTSYGEPIEIRDTGSRRKSRYRSLGPRVIAGRLSKKGRVVTRNMVIGRFHRIDGKVKPSETPPPVEPECKAALPPQPRIRRATSCGESGCRNQPIPYSSHGLCSVHNADRLAKLPRPNRGSEIATSVSAGYMG